ncbi:MAG: hypothetical protein AMXMBFR64_10640 [Myxococcales bacterium]
MAVSVREIMNLPEHRPVRATLVVDQGDGAVRVLRALREAGVDAVLLSGRGHAAPERALAHRIVALPGFPWSAHRQGDPARLVDAIVDAADACGVDSIHFGYSPAGHDPRVVGALERHGLVVLGPSRATLERELERSAEPAAAPVVGVVVAVDAWGSAVALGDRDAIARADGRVVADCSPSSLGDRDKVWREAVRVALAVGLRGVGTVDVAVDDAGAPLGVRAVHGGLHPGDLVVEETTGIDLVAEQLRLASGHPVALPTDARGHGAAVQCRILAIDPLDGETADRGVIRGLTLPCGAGVRVEPKVAVGSAVDPADPVIARIACRGRDRDAALRRLDTALATTSVVGVRTNVPLLRAVIGDGELDAGGLDDALRRAGQRLAQPDHETEVAIAALIAAHWVKAPSKPVTSRWHAHGRVLDMGGV